MITPVEQRRVALEKAGVPLGFLDAVENPKLYPDLKYVANSPESAYFYLPGIHESYSCLRGATVTPVCDGSNGDTFYVLLSAQAGCRFVLFELERDEIYKDFGADFRYMCADILINLYESSELSIEDLTTIGRAMGFEEAASLYEALLQADKMKARSTFEKDREWRASTIPRLLGQPALE